MLGFWKNYKRQNWFIKIGFATLAVSLLFAILALTLIGTAKFRMPENTSNSRLAAKNGFVFISNNGIQYAFKSKDFWSTYGTFHSEIPNNIPILRQLIAGIYFLLIFLPISSGVCLLSLIVGYFKRWLYT